METSTKIFCIVAVCFVILLSGSIYLVKSGIYAEVFTPAHPPPQPMITRYFKAFVGPAFERGEQQELAAEFAVVGKNFSYTAHSIVGDWLALSLPASLESLEVLAHVEGYYNQRIFVAREALVDGGKTHAPMIPFTPVIVQAAPARLGANTVQTYDLTVNATGFVRATGVCFDWTPSILWATLDRAIIQCPGGWMQTTGSKDAVTGKEGVYPSLLYRCPALQNRTQICASLEAQGVGCVSSGDPIPRRLQHEVVKCFDLDQDYDRNVENLTLRIKTGALSGNDKVVVWLVDKDQFFQGDRIVYRQERLADGVYVDVGMPDVMLDIPAQEGV